MKTEYHRWFSRSLGQDMELKVYGHGGRGLLGLPCQGGNCTEWEGFEMINTLAPWIDAGRLTVFAIGSVDNQSWANTSAPPAERAKRHQQYDEYVMGEVVPLMRERVGAQPLMVAGCSLGGYHAANLYFRHPEVFGVGLSLSGLFQLSDFIGDYCDDNVYYNTPLRFLPNLHDEATLALYRRGTFVACCGQGDWDWLMLADIRALKHVLEAKGIPAWIDIWGHDVSHDWCWWYKQMYYFMCHVLGEPSGAPTA
eukprot:m51a1_g5448 hypothetical protein (253) ;mRNA; r:204968-205933